MKIFVCSGAVALIAGSAAAGVGVTSSERRVDVFVEAIELGFDGLPPTVIESFTDSEELLDTNGLFDAEVVYENTMFFIPVPEGEMNPLARQTSNIDVSGGDLALSAQGLARGLVPDTDLSTEVEFNAGSALTVEFNVSEPTAYSLTGLLEAQTLLNFAPGMVSVSLTGPGGSVFDLSVGPTVWGGDELLTLNLNEQGVLAPGAYTFALDADFGGGQSIAGEFAFGGEGRYDLLFRVPTPGALAAAPFGAWLLIRRRR
jgi:hypothetical protein